MPYAVTTCGRRVMSSAGRACSSTGQRSLVRSRLCRVVLSTPNRLAHTTFHFDFPLGLCTFLPQRAYQQRSPSRKYPTLRSDSPAYILRFRRACVCVSSFVHSTPTPYASPDSNKAIFIALSARTYRSAITNRRTSAIAYTTSERVSNTVA